MNTKLATIKDLEVWGVEIVKEDRQSGDDENYQPKETQREWTHIHNIHRFKTTTFR